MGMGVPGMGFPPEWELGLNKDGNGNGLVGSQNHSRGLYS